MNSEKLGEIVEPCGLYEVAVVELPTEKEKETGAVPRLLIPPTPVIARDETAAALAIGADAALLGKNAGRLRVLIRPFVPPRP